MSEGNKNKNKKKFNASKVNKVIWGAVFVLGVYYVVSVNSLSILGFELRDSKEKISYLNSQNDANEARIMSLESLSNINTRMQKLKMVKVDKVEYIDAVEVVAKR